MIGLNRFINFIGILAGVVCLTIAPANTTPFRQHLFANIALGYGQAHLDAASGLKHTSAKGFVYDIAAGYHFQPHWGVELAFTQFKRLFVGTDHHQLDTYVMSAALRYQHPLWRHVSGLIKLGLAGQRRVGSLSSSHASQDAVAAYTGLGVLYQATPNIELTSELDASFGKLTTFDAVAGLSFLIDV